MLPPSNPWSRPATSAGAVWVVGSARVLGSFTTDGAYGGGPADQCRYRRDVHPIERLRYVARSQGAPQDLLVAETAGALAAFRDDPVALVTACRRVVSRQLTAGALWWLCSRMLCSADPTAEARAAVDEIESDETGDHLALHLPDGATVAVLGWPALAGAALARRGDLDVLVVESMGEGSSFATYLQSRDVDAVDVSSSGLGAAVAAADLVVIEAAAMSTDAFIAAAGSRAAAAVARHAGTPVWLVAGVGRVLPQRVWQALTARLDARDEPWDLDEEIVPIDLVDRIVGPGGFDAPEHLASRVDCPIAPELFKSDIT